MKSCKNILFAVLGLTMMPMPGFAAGSTYWQAPKKKIIGCGWESSMSIEHLSRILPELEKNSPYNGITLRFKGQHDDGHTFTTTYGFSPDPDDKNGTAVVRWKYEWFKKDIELLKSIKFTRFKDNFIWVNSRDGNVEWFNDQQWSDLCSNFGILARIAKETGLKGIMFDAEYYTRSKNVFAQKTPGKSYDEMAAMARQRGREWGKAIFDQYPDIILFCPFIFSWKESLCNAPENCNWTVPFFNGVYDVLPPTATMVEGHEYHGYACATGADYAALRADMAVTLAKFVAPENLAKYRLQTCLGCAIYLDPYVFPGKPDTFRRRIAPEIAKTNALTTLRRNLFHALNTSDEYVWVWSEGARWHNSKPGHPGVKKVWQKVAPGIRDVFESVQEPVAYARKKVSSRNAASRSGNPFFAEKFIKPNRPSGYDFWLSGAKDKGTCVKVSGAGIGGKDAVTITGCSSSLTFSLEPAVTPDQMFYAKVRIKIDKEITAKYALMIQFCDAATKRYCWYRECFSTRFSEPDADGWRTAELVALVPQGFNKMFVRLMGSWMQPEDKVTVGSFELYRLKEAFLAPCAQ